MKVLILGAAVSGKAAMRLASRLGDEVFLYDADPETLVGVDAGATASGPFEATLLDGVDVVVASPGISEHSHAIQTVLRAEVALWSEIELASHHLDTPLAAITGTNGKTTTTVAAAEMLVASGIAARAVGNVGDPLSDEVGSHHDALVVEASSFQLRFIDTFHPVAAAVLNVAPDHLDWHDSMDAYVAAKARITENQVSDDIIVFDPDDAGSLAAVAASNATRIPVSGSRRPDGGNGPAGNHLHIAEHVMVRPDLDDAFLFDLTVAGTLALRMGASPEGVEAVIAGFTSGIHRRQVIGIWHDVVWINDSKATNPHAAAAAVRAYESVVLIAGGRNKGLDLAPVVEPQSLRHVVAIGEAAAELADLVPQARFTPAATMTDAVAIAATIAVAGDTVLLAPACASFDMFVDYAERGDVFAAEARRLHDSNIRGGI